MKNAIGPTIFAIFLFFAPLLQASNLRLETSDLIVSDSTGNISDERLRDLSNYAQESLNKVLAFWYIDSGAARSKKYA